MVAATMGEWLSLVWLGRCGVCWRMAGAAAAITGLVVGCCCCWWFLLQKAIVDTVSPGGAAGRLLVDGGTVNAWLRRRFR
jgi:hypothetical protein